MITLHFQAETWPEIDEQMRRALGVPIPIYTHQMNPSEFPDDEPADYLDPEAEEAAVTAPIAQQEPAKSKRSHKKSAPAPATHEPAPEPEPAPAPAPAPAPELDPALPTIDALKQIVTKAVRAAQKGEGSKKILDLLPEFKAKTKLDFVMNAENAHYAALNDLIVEAGLVAV